MDTISNELAAWTLRGGDHTALPATPPAAWYADASLPPSVILGPNMSSAHSVRSTSNVDQRALHPIPPA